LVERFTLNFVPENFFTYSGLSRSTDFEGNDIPASFTVSGTVTVTNSVLQITGHD